MAVYSGLNLTPLSFGSREFVLWMQFAMAAGGGLKPNQIGEHLSGTGLGRSE